MMKRFCILIVAVMTVTAVLGQSADQWLKQGNDYYEKQQFSKAVECYQQAAEAGSQEGQFNLGYALYNGHSITWPIAICTAEGCLSTTTRHCVT